MSRVHPTIARALELTHSGDQRGAEAVLRPHVAANPRDAHACNVLAIVLSRQRRIEEAVEFARRANEIHAAYPDAMCTLGSLLLQLDRAGEAAEWFARAVAMAPGSAQAWNGRALTLWKTEDVSGAREAFERAVELEPRAVGVWANYARMEGESGDQRASVKVLRRAVKAHPRDATLLAMLCQGLSYESVSGEEILDAHRQLGAVLGAESVREWSNARDPKRPLRVAYLSPDFRDHPVGLFVEPLIRGHDRAAFKVYCYATNDLPARADDPVAARLRSYDVTWRDVSALSAAQLREAAIADGVDILVDLAGLTAGNRAPALAMRMAPVQCTYLGYPSTTGIGAVDYRIADSRTDAPGAERWGTEKLVRLDPVFLCYSPARDAPDVAPPPSLAAGRVTLGSFNNTQKYSAATIDAWAKLLGAVPGSRLVLKALHLRSAAAKERWRGAFTARGVDAGRIELLDPVAGAGEHMGAYARVDVALDPFPYNGTTTTCEALRMGVPVVTLEGGLHAGRVGASLLTAIGRADLIARDVDEYVSIAAGLAADPARLTALRSSLRESMRSSPLCDASAFVKRFETALRRVWTEWCGAHG